MKKMILLLFFLCALVIFTPKSVDALDQNEYVVSNYSELTSALSKTSNVYTTTIVINGTVNLESDITISGKVRFVGSENSVLSFENGTRKRTIKNTKNSEIRFENLTISRTVADNTEGFLFRCDQNGTLWFEEVTFNVAALPEVSTDLDRITYCPSGVDLTLYFNNCTFNTEAYFYRGTMVFFNNEVTPPTAGSPTIKNFNDLKINYETKEITFPSEIKVSEDSDFVKTIKSGSMFKSATTYYVSKDNFTFSFTTKNLKLETPTLASVNIDYENEVITFTEKYVVSLDPTFNMLVSSGDKVSPGMTLYIKALGEGIFFDSDIYEAKLPERPQPILLEADFTCSFGFVMKYYDNVEFSIGEDYQLSPVFIGLERNKTYTVSMRLKATDSSFASEAVTTTVTTTE